MFRRIAPAVVVVLIVVVASLALIERDEGAAPPAAPAGGSVTPSPAIVAVDGVAGLPATVAELPNADADTFRSLLGELRGTPVVVNLWASWCEPCEREMPMLARAAERRTDVQFLGVDTLDSREGAEAFIVEFAVPFPSLFDPDGAIRTDLASNGLPVTVFFDADGNPVRKVDGELSQDALDEHLAAISG
ncbi:MAG TPA: TlpA disulfide reductase family protein [Nocardioidaceae bacterium]|nr:TlpA disulfide reductase family protein [Nocardioidaceae bacterium]